MPGTFPYLHPNMYLLIRKIPTEEDPSQYDLHPNMYLLIPMRVHKVYHKIENLHPNMYLLIHGIPLAYMDFSKAFTSQHVSINSRMRKIRISRYSSFTSQHVSINSGYPYSREA